MQVKYQGLLTRLSLLAPWNWSPRSCHRPERLLWWRPREPWFTQWECEASRLFFESFTMAKNGNQYTGQEHRQQWIPV